MFSEGYDCGDQCRHHEWIVDLSEAGFVTGLAHLFSSVWTKYLFSIFVIPDCYKWGPKGSGYLKECDVTSYSFGGVGVGRCFLDGHVDSKDGQALGGSSMN